MSTGQHALLETVRGLFLESRRQIEHEIKGLGDKVTTLSDKLDEYASKVVELDKAMAVRAPTTEADQKRITDLEAEVQRLQGKVHDMETSSAKTSWVPVLASALVSTLLLFGMDQLRKPAPAAPAAAPAPVIIYAPSTNP